MSRIVAVARAFLLWLDAVNREKPVTERFLDHPSAAVDGTHVTDRELTRVVARLHAAGLVTGIGADQSERLLRVWLTSDGERCVDDFDADLSRWDSKDVSKWDQSVHVSAGGDAQVAAHSDNVTQVQSAGDVNVGELRKAAELARDAIPSLGLPEDAATEVADASKEILAEAEKPEPDQKKLRTLGERLRDRVSLASGSATIVKLIMDLLGGAGF